MNGLNNFRFTFVDEFEPTFFAAFHSSIYGKTGFTFLCVPFFIKNETESEAL